MAAEGRDVRERRIVLERAHDRGRADECTERQPTPQRFRQHEEVGNHVPMLKAEERAGAAEPGHHFVEDQQRADVVAAPPERGQELGRRDADAGFGLHRLHDHRGGVAVDRR